MRCKGFPRSHRLLSPAQFQRLFKGAVWRLKLPGLTVLAAPNDLDHPRLGIALAKRYAKKAVERNRIRRQLRESFRLHQRHLPGVDVVILGGFGVDRLPLNALRGAVDKLWIELAKRCKNS